MSIAPYQVTIKAMMKLIKIDNFSHIPDDQQSTVAGMSKGFFKGAHHFNVIGGQFIEVLLFKMYLSLLKTLTQAQSLQSPTFFKHCFTTFTSEAT